MNQPPIETTPAPETPDYSALFEEQKAVIAAMNDKIKALEAKSASAEAKITALSGQQQAQPAATEKAEAAKSALDVAYEKVLIELGLKKE